MTRNRTRMIALAAGTALVTIGLGGCATKAAPRADLSASKAEVLLAKGKTDQAIAHAEAAVQAEPRSAAYRAMLGAAYLDAGRFESAAQTFDDAMALGDNTARTALTYALAEIGAGNNGDALSVLDDWRDDIDPADLGLALALAGEADQGVHILGNALRAGANTPKVRQNLAYAYALQGNWIAARVMAAEDVPVDQLEERLSEWARSSRAEDYNRRVAALLSVPVVADAGQPARLALANTPSAEQMVAEAAALVPSAQEPAPAQALAETDAGELPPLSSAGIEPQVAVVEPVAPTPEKFEEAFAAPAPAGATFAQMTESALRFVSEPVVQKMPARYGAAMPEQAPERAVPRRAEPRIASRSIAQRDQAPAGGSHLVQLGSFASEQGARRAWGIYTSKYAGLDRYEMVITEAVVRGKKYYRVSAGNMASSAATSMCSSVRASGSGCIAWAEGRPLPGAIETGVRMASR